MISPESIIIERKKLKVKNMFLNATKKQEKLGLLGQ
jgi:hypothetical protein